MLKIRPRAPLAAPDGADGPSAASAPPQGPAPARYLSGRAGGMPAPRRQAAGEDAAADQPAEPWGPVS